jgi:branched-chain amino acid transport system permease protein
MIEFAQNIVGGLLQGAIFALLSLGFTVVFRVTRAINLTEGAFCIAAALLTHTLSQTLHWPLALAVLTAVLGTTAYAAAIGALVFVPALRRLVPSSMLILMAGLLILSEGLVLAIWGSNPYALPLFSGEQPLRIGGIRVPTQFFWMIGAMGLVVLAMWYLFAGTRVGKALEACAENPWAATLMGIDVRRMALLSLVLSALVGAIGGIAIAPMIALQFTTVEVFSISGFIAVILGGMGSFVGAVIGGFVLGFGKQFAAAYVSSMFADGLALILLLLVLLLRPSGLVAWGRLRRVDVRDGQPVYGAVVRLTGGRALGLRLALLAFCLLLPLLVGQGILGSLVVAAILFIALMGLDVLVGYAGQVSLCQGAFMAIGGYTSALLAMNGALPPGLAILAGIGLAVLCALGLALATMRLQGHYLALATLAFGLVVDSLILGFRDLTGGPSGLAGVPGFSLFGWSLETDLAMFYFVVLLAALLYVVLNAGLSRGFGRALMAVRADGLAASALGIHIRRLKLTAFALSAALGALSGGLYAHYMQFASPEMGTSVRSIELITMLVIGGEGTLLGPLVGAVGLTLLPVLFQPLAAYKTLAEGLLLVLVIRYMPEGVLGRAWVGFTTPRARPAALAAVAAGEAGVLTPRPAPLAGGPDRGAWRRRRR